MYGEQRHANDYLKTSAYEQFKILEKYHRCLVTQLCLTLQDPLDCSPVHQVPLSMGFFQARILAWLAISSCRGSSWPRDGTQASCLSCIAGKCLTHWAIEASLSLREVLPQSEGEQPQELQEWPTQRCLFHLNGISGTEWGLGWEDNWGPWGLSGKHVGGSTETVVPDLPPERNLPHHFCL